MLDLIVISSHFLHWYFDALLDVFDVPLLVRHILDTTDRSHWRQLPTSHSSHLVLHCLGRTPYKLSCLEQT